MPEAAVDKDGEAAISVDEVGLALQWNASSPSYKSESPKKSGQAQFGRLVPSSSNSTHAFRPSRN